MQFRSMRLAILLSLIVSFAAEGPAQQPEVQPSAPSVDARQILDLTNEARSEQGLEPLRWDSALASAAELHNQVMRDKPELAHQYPDEAPLLQRASQQGAHFASIAENIAMGPSVAAIQREWLHSAPHRANIFDPRMDSIGISVTRRGSDFYATEDFAHAVEDVAPAAAELKIASLLRQQGLVVSTEPNALRDARETCEMSSGSAGGTQPRSIVRWEGPDLNALPPAVTQRATNGQFKSAVVGSCTSMHPQQGFTTFRFAVLLF